MKEQPTRISVTMPTSEWDDVVSELDGLQLIIRQEVAGSMASPMTTMNYLDGLVHKLRLVTTTTARLNDKLEGGSDLIKEFEEQEHEFFQERSELNGRIRELEQEVRNGNREIERLEQLKDKRTASKKQKLNLGA